MSRRQWPENKNWVYWLQQKCICSLEKQAGQVPWWHGANYFVLSMPHAKQTEPGAPQMLSNLSLRVAQRRKDMILVWYGKRLGTPPEFRWYFCKGMPWLLGNLGKHRWGQPNCITWEKKRPAAIIPSLIHSSPIEWGHDKSSNSQTVMCIELTWGRGCHGEPSPAGQGGTWALTFNKLPGVANAAGPVAHILSSKCNRSCETRETTELSKTWSLTLRSL